MRTFENLSEYNLRNRDIKVSLDDMKFLLSQIEDYFGEHLNAISEEDYDRVTTIFNKYLVISQLRDEEALWFNAMKKCDEVKNQDMSTSRREAYGFYIAAKNEREILQAEIEKV